MTAAIDQARLRELAEAAHHIYGDDWIEFFPGWDRPAAEFAALASPATILALLDALSAERERGDRAEWKPIKSGDYGCQTYLLWDGDLVIPGWQCDDGWVAEASSSTGMLMDPQPTHIRSLPAPPLATQKAEGA